MTPNVKYNAQDDVLLVWLSERDIYDATMAGQVILHTDKQGEPVLLEILEASRFVGTLKDAIETAHSGKRGRNAA